jgi:hypothetical protein
MLLSSRKSESWTYGSRISNLGSGIFPFQIRIPDPRLKKNWIPDPNPQIGQKQNTKFLENRYNTDLIRAGTVTLPKPKFIQLKKK